MKLAILKGQSIRVWFEQEWKDYAGPLSAQFDGGSLILTESTQLAGGAKHERLIGAWGSGIWLKSCMAPGS